jgi:hypothetical protein
MGLFDWLIGPRNPTKDWPLEGILPPFDLNSRSFGFLRFCDNLESARRLGRPDQCNYLKKTDSWCLEYNSRGYHLSFTKDRLVDAFFFIGTGGEFRLKPSDPKAQPLLSTGERLHENMQQADIIRLFGPPAPQEEFDDEFDDDCTTLDYPGSNVSMEFEFNSDGKLSYWHLFEPWPSEHGHRS